MNIFLIHGDHTAKSYDRLTTYINAAVKKGWDVVKPQEKGISIQEAVVSQSLFQNEKLVVIENANTLKVNELKWLNKNKDINANVVVYHPSTIPKTTINKLPNVKKNEEFKLPKAIWNFLDSFFPGNAKNTMLLFHRVVEKEPVEFVVSLLAKQLRDLYHIKAVGTIPGYPSWRIGKLKNSANKFKAGLLEKIIFDLAKNDLRSKTSNANMTDALDFIIATKLK